MDLPMVSKSLDLTLVVTTDKTIIVRPLIVVIVAVEATVVAVATMEGEATVEEISEVEAMGVIKEGASVVVVVIIMAEASNVFVQCCSR